MSDAAKKIDDHTIQFVRILPGPIEKIWPYLADSDKRGEWFAKGPLPAKVGEDFTLSFKHSDMSPHKAPAPESMKEVDEKGHTSTNTLLAFEPPHRLAFVFGRGSRVEMVLTQEGDVKDNKVRLTLTHSQIPDDGYRLAVSGGWHTHLEVLQYRAENKTPPAFWDIWRKNNEAYAKA